MRVIIAGGGRIGAQLALQLVAAKHDVRLIERRREVLSHIHRELPTEVIYEGSATDPQVLEQAGVRAAQVAVASMERDAENLTFCFLARARYAVGRTIACINHPRNAWLFDKAFHVDVALNQSDILANLIEQEMSLGDMMTLLKLRRGRLSVVSEKIGEGAPAVGVALQDLPIPRQCVIAAIVRSSGMVIPRGPVRFAVGDEVLAVVDAEAAVELARLLGGALPGA